MPEIMRQGSEIIIVLTIEQAESILKNAAWAPDGETLRQIRVKVEEYHGTKKDVQ